MKHLRAVVALSALFAVATITPAQVKPKYETVYESREKSYALASVPAFELELFSRKWPVEAFTGTSNFGVPVVGFKANVWDTKLSKITYPDGMYKVIRGGIDFALATEQSRNPRFAIWFKVSF